MTVTGARGAGGLPDEDYTDGLDPSAVIPDHSTLHRGSGGRGLFRGRVESRLGDLVFAAAGLTTFLWLMLLGRTETFFYDEWNFIDTRGTSYWYEVLQPHNGHPSMVPYTIYQVLLATVGLHHYWPYRLVLTCLDLVAGYFLYLLLRTRISPLVAAAAAGVLMLLGPAWQDLLWAFQIGFLGSVAGGLVALYFLDRRTRRSDIAATACLVVAVGCSGVALPFLGGFVVELAWRRQWRRLWIPALPFLAFLIWYLAKDRSETKSGLPAIGAAVHYYGQAAVSTVGSLVGGNTDIGTALGIVLVVLAAGAFVAGPRYAGRLLFSVVALLAFWTLTVVARTISLPVASRYLLPGGVFVLLGAAESVALLMRAGAARRWVTRWRPPLRTVGLTVATAMTVLGGAIVYWNAAQMDAGAGFLASWSADVRAGLGAVQLEGGRLSPGFEPMPSLVPQISAGPYLAAVAAYGSPAVTVAQLSTLPEGELQLVDQTMLAGVPFSERLSQTSTVTGSSCGVPAGSGPSSSLIVTFPRSGLEISTVGTSTHLTLAVRGYGDAFVPDGVISVPGRDSAVVIRWPGQWSPGLRWTLQLSPGKHESSQVLTGLRCTPAGYSPGIG